MNVLQILPELNVGGVETGTIDFARYLVEKGHGSFVVSNGGRLVERLEQEGSRHFTLPVHKKSFLQMIRLVRPLRKIIQDNKIDIVHARSRVPAWIAFFAVRKTRASFITTCHGHYGNPLFSQVMGFSKRVIVPSEAIGRHMVETFGVSPDHIRCIPRSVDLDRFKRQGDITKDPNVFTVTMLGRITPLKGHEYFIRAMAKVIRQYPFVRVNVVGDAPPKKINYKKGLELLVRRMGLTDHVKFLGNRSDIPEILWASDALVLSTVTQESFGRVILEAQAAGVPVVATKVGGVVDIIDHEENGLLVMPKDPDDMAAQVVRLIKNRKLAGRLVEKGLEKIHERFTIDHMASQTLAVYEELLKLKNILVLKFSSVGDVVLVTASLKAIRKKFPEAHLTVVVGRAARNVLMNCPLIDDLVVLDETKGIGGWRNIWRIARRLRRQHIDVVVDFQNNKKSHALSWLVMPKRSFGFNNGKWSGLLTDAVKSDANMSPVAHQFQLLEKISIPYRETAALQLWPSSKDKRTVENLLESEWLSNARTIVGINISASRKWKTKNWPTEYIAELCDLLAKKNIRVVLTGMASDAGLAHDVIRQCDSKPNNFVGKTTIPQLAALLSRCQVYVTSDSAPLHIAAAMNVPVIAMFGPTDSTRHIPPAKKIVVMERKLACSPCYKSTCPILTHACMRDILPEMVFDRIEELIGERV